jgi:alkanesulfonate monooxygenase SsuD/methylene tetrahydromethanopterin reductase-like flavin-dependent oxidoreductase (luciferase family)
MDDRQIRFGLYYDFRNPQQWRQPFDRLYAEIFDQIVWAESNGFDDVWLSEHHFIEDGYLPSLLPVAAAIAARTRKIRIGLAVMLMPFQNPVRLAEEIAVVDVISGGRLDLGFGVGYKIEEFEGFGIPTKQAGTRTNQSLEIVSRLLAGETVSYKSDYFELNRARITPEPIQKPRPPIWIGGFTQPALRRAARFGDGFIASMVNPSIYESYLAELRKRGTSTDHVKLASGFQWLIVSNDQEKTWNEAADHIVYQADNYAAWTEKALQNIDEKTRARMVKEGIKLQTLTYLRDRDGLRRSGQFHVVEPDTAIRMIRDYVESVPLTHYYSWTLPPGLSPQWVQPHLELFASKVIPAFRQNA